MGIPLQRSQPTYKMSWTIYLFKTQSNISQIKRSFRVLDQLVDVADEGATGHVAAGDLVDRHFHLRHGYCIQQKELIVYYVRVSWLYQIFNVIYQARVCRQPLDGVKRVAGQPG